MTSRRFTAGGVAVELDNGLEAFIEQALASAETAAIRALRAHANAVAAEAERDWYGPKGVQRRTGLSGQMAVRESIDLTKGEITFSVGSTDTRRANGKPVPVFVRRPGRTSTVLKVVTTREYFAAPVAMRGPWLPGPPKTPQLFVPNPAASDGKLLISELLRKPMRKRVKAIVQDMAAELRRG